MARLSGGLCSGAGSNDGGAGIGDGSSSGRGLVWLGMVVQLLLAVFPRMLVRISVYMLYWACIDWACVLLKTSTKIGESDS